MAGFLRQHWPGATILFLGRNYTKDIIALSEHVDEFVNYDELQALSKEEQVAVMQQVKADLIIHVFPKKEIAVLAKKAGIPLRVGTRNRLYHWFTCNKLVALSRKNSSLHEAQLNIKLLSFLGFETDLPLQAIPKLYGFSKMPVLEPDFQQWVDPEKFNLILHPRSKGSAKEWGLDNFQKLVQQLPPEKYKIFISGTAEDAKTMQEFLENTPGVSNITGKLNLQQFIAFINQCNGLVAASTGPLHIAAALNKVAIGVFSPKRPIHPGRWMPLGPKAHAIVYDERCPACAEGKECDCITKIKPEQIVDLIEKSRQV